MFVIVTSNEQKTGINAEEISALMPVFYYLRNIVLFSARSFAFTIGAAISAALTVGKAELVAKLLLSGCYAAGVCAFNYIAHNLRQSQIFALYKLAVANDVDSYAGVNIAKNIKIQVNYLRNLYYVLFALFAAVSVLYHCNSTFQLPKVENVVNVHAASGCNVVKNDTVNQFSNYHISVVLSSVSLYVKQLEYERHAHILAVKHLVKITGAWVVVNSN